ncbi:MAG TPA: protein kinase, partial [Pirellulaceae bacterium]|nr:protein kinase [Pirellulaceae bacterium]
MKITDFGLARVAVDKVELTSHESALGTPAYMSPEQLRGEKLDARTDLFSLGCVLFAMVTGNSPFYGKSTFEVTTKVATMFPRPLREIDPSVPDFFSDLVESLLDKRADRRPSSAQHVADLLNQQLAVLNQTPTDKLSTLWPKASSEPFDTGSAATLDLPVRPGSKHTKSAGDPADGARLAPSARVNPWIPAVVTTAVALAAMVALFFAFRQDGKGAGTGGKVEVPPEKTGTGSPPKSPTRKSLVLVGNAVVEEGDLKVDCRTIGEALRLVAPGGVIRVIDEFEYREAVVIDDAERHRGISIVSDREAILAPPNGAPPTAATLRIIDVPEVTLKGLTIQGEGLRAAVSIEGRSQGCKLEGVKCSVLGAGGPSAMILLRPTGMTANDSPIVVSGCVVEASPGAAGVRVQTDKGAGAVELRRCTVRNGTTGIHVVADVAAPPGRLKIERCDLIGVQTGVLLEWAAPPPADGLQLLNNTIVAADSWLQIAPTPAWPKTVPGEAPMQSIGAIVNNLAIGGAAKLRGEFQNARAAELFVVKSNWRAPSDSAQAADA